jgi:hypothetical protein
MWKIARRPASRVALFAVGLAAGATAVVAGPAAPAAATIPGIEVVTARSATDSYDKTVTVHCPDGKKVVDAGGYIEGGDGQVTIDDIYPDQNLNYVNVTGLENDSTSDTWTAVATATCANALVGLEWVKARSVSDSNSPKTITATCNPGKTVFGSGYTVTGGDGAVVVNEAVPNGGSSTAATQVTVKAYEADTFSGNWEADAFLICGDPRPGQRVLSGQITVSGNSGTRVSCGDQYATGSTGQLFNGAGMVLMASDFSGDNSSGTIRGEVIDGYTGTWTGREYVFCADK